MIVIDCIATFISIFMFMNVGLCIGYADEQGILAKTFTPIVVILLSKICLRKYKSILF